MAQAPSAGKMAAFFDALRLTWKKTTKPELSDKSAAINSYTDGFTQGVTYQGISHNYPQPITGFAFGGAHQMDTSPFSSPVAPTEPSNEVRGEGELRTEEAGGENSTYMVSDDYVTFTRCPNSISRATTCKANVLKVNMELFFNNSIKFTAERNTRCEPPTPSIDTPATLRDLCDC